MLSNKESKIEYDRNYYLRNRDKILARKKIYQKENSKSIYETKKKYRLENRDTINKKLNRYLVGYRERNKDRMREYAKKLYAKNSVKINNRIKERINTEPLFKLKLSLRNRLYKFLSVNGKTKTCKFNDYIGCSPVFLKEYIGNQFVDGMTWENHGKWHIDHIKPLSSAKNDEEIYRLCHYSNLMPLWAGDNLSKKDKILSENTGVYFAFPSQDTEAFEHLTEL